MKWGKTSYGWALVLFLLILSGCSGAGEGRGGNLSGPIVFGLDWPLESANNSEVRGLSKQLARELDCDAAGVETVTVSVYTAGGTHLTGKTFACILHQGTMDGIPAGADRTFVFEGKNSADVTVYRGMVTGVDLDAGVTTDLGTISMSPTENTPPSVQIISPSNGATFATGQEITFRGAGNDPEEGTLTGESLVWTSSLDGALGTGESLTDSVLSTGTHIITLTATDSRGATAVAQIALTITTNHVPTAAITAPTDGASFSSGTLVTFTGTGDDPEDGPLSGATLIWSSDRDGQIGTGASLATGALSAGSHTITLTTVDGEGAVAIARITITITSEGPPPTNTPPTATITSPANGGSYASGQAIAFTGTGSDPEDGSLTGAALVWTSSINGQIGTGSSFNISTLPVGTHIITLTATDSKGAKGVAQVILTVGSNRAPTAMIVSPTDGNVFLRGDNVTFTGSGNDPEDGTLTGSSLSWSSNLDGSIGTGETFSIGTLSAGTHTISLRVTDRQGITGTATVRVVINQPPVSVITAPSDGSYYFQGETITISGTGSDPEDGSLGGTSLVWTSDINGQIGTGGSFTTSALSGGGSHAIILTVRDSRGSTGIAQVNVHIISTTQRQWLLSTVGSVGTGSHTSIALDSNNMAHISNGDFSNGGKLSYATNISTSWVASILDNYGANATSIATDSNTHVHICYSDSGNFKYATNVSGSWVISTINLSSGALLRGDSCAIAMDSNDKVHISYGDYETLKYVTNASGSWVISTIDVGGSGFESSIAIDSNNKAHISYWDSINSDLKYATNVSGSWATSTIDSSGKVGRSSSIAIDQNNKVHISYVDSTDPNSVTLKYATNVSGSWVTSPIDNPVGDVTSIAIDTNNKVHISYSNLAGLNNFGPRYATNLSGSWVTSTIDSEGAMFSDIAIDSNNKVHISYMGSSRLKYAVTDSGIIDFTKPENPALSINHGAVSSPSTSVTLTLSATDYGYVSAYYASESPTIPANDDPAWTTISNPVKQYSAEVPFVLTAGNGTKTVNVWFKDVAGNVSPGASASIILNWVTGF